MITRLLLLLNLCVVDLDLVARALAADVLRVHDAAALDQPGTLRELQRRYVLVAVETGLPVGAQRRVSVLAWQYIVAARAEMPDTVNRREFGFY